MENVPFQIKKTQDGKLPFRNASNAIQIEMLNLTISFSNVIKANVKGNGTSNYVRRNKNKMKVLMLRLQNVTLRENNYLFHNKISHIYEIFVLIVIEN